MKHLLGCFAFYSFRWTISDITEENVVSCIFSMAFFPDTSNQYEESR